VTSVSDKLPFVMPDLGVHAQAPQQLHEELANGLKQLRALVGISGTTSSAPSANPALDILHPSCCRIVVLNKTWPTWEKAMDEVGGILKNFRSRRQPDYQNVKNVLSGSSSGLPSVERSAFGLPIVFYYRSLDGQKGTLEGSTNDRRASPLLIRVSRLANGNYTVVMTVFQSALLDGAEKLVLKRGRRVLATAATPSLSLIDAFLSEISKTIPLLEVKKW